MDFSVKNLINIALEEGKDVFLKTQLPGYDLLADDDVLSVIFMSSSFYGGKGFRFCDITREIDYSDINVTDTLVADIRFMSSDDFRDFLTKRNIRRFYIPFAETTVLGEYCYREAYRWIGEYRAERKDFCQVVGFYPPSFSDFSSAYEIFGTSEAILVNTDKEKEFTAFSCSDTKAKFYFTAAEAEKFAHKRVAVVFNSRGEAAEFSRFLNKRGTSFQLLDGAVSSENRKIIIDRFISGECMIILATKAIIPESLFTLSDRCIFAGVPFSKAHIYRLQNMASELTVIFSKDDFSRNMKISRSLADKTGNEEFFINRAAFAEEVMQLLENV